MYTYGLRSLFFSGRIRRGSRAGIWIPFCLSLLSSPVWAQEAAESPLQEAAAEQETPAGPVAEPNAALIDESGWQIIELTPEEIEAASAQEQARIDALAEALQEARDVRYRRHLVLGVSCFPAGVIVSALTGRGGFFMLSTAAGIGVITNLKQFKDVKEIDQELAWLKRETAHTMELTERFLSRMGDDGRKSSAPMRGSLLAGSVLFYGVSVQAELGPVAYNLGGLMMMGGVAQMFRSSPEERIEQAYAQRKNEIGRRPR
jgi:predicted phage tail protein